ncbi:MAG: PilZ domain-containing protein [Bacteriovoracaceae bacterium]|nr:PilZ domain-containing protein [Bacteriovoracaceae bacterium]
MPNRGDRVQRRINIKKQVWLRTKEGTTGPFFSKDISLSGIFVETTETLPPKTKCIVEINIADHGDTKNLIMLKSIVMRTTENGMGIRFVEMDGKIFSCITNIIAEAEQAQID